VELVSWVLLRCEGGCTEFGNDEGDEGDVAEDVEHGGCV
jgi:hypothetical protein